MKVLVRTLSIVLLLECLGLGWYATQYQASVIPVLPKANFDDPFYADAIKEFAEQAESGGSAEWQTLGEALLGQGFYGEAELAFRQSVLLNPKNYLSHFALAFCLDRTGRMELSTEEYLEAAKIERDSEEAVASPSHAMYQAGKNYLRLEQPEKALELFEQNQMFSPATYQLAKLLIRTGQSERALRVIEPVLEKAPTSLKFNSLYLHLMEEQGKTKEAFQAGQRLEYAQYFVPVDFNTKYVTPFSNVCGFPKRLQAYNRILDSGNMDLVATKLESLYEQIAETNMPQRAMLQQSLAAVEFQRRNPEKILEAVKKLDELGIKSAERLQMEGAAYALLGQLDQAAELWERAALMSPNIPLHQMLAKYYDQKEDIAKRDEHLGQAELLSAKIEYWSHRPENAKQAIDKAIQLLPDDDEVWFYLAEIESALNNGDAAVNAYRTCLDKNEYHGKAMEALKVLSNK